MKYLIYDTEKEKYFQSQDEWFVIWSEKGLEMDHVDAEIRIGIILRTCPDLKERLTIVEHK